MLKPNTRYKDLKDTYLFNTICRKTNEYLEANAATFHGYMPEVGAGELRRAI